MRTLLAIGCTLLGCGIAQADWQYTKWGMTKSEIIAASKGEAREMRQGEDFLCNNGRKVIAVVQRKTLAGSDFSVKFCAFADGRLSSIRLDSTTANTYQLKQTMISQYGQPVSMERGDFLWNDKKSGNTVIFSDIAGVVSMIEYKPLGGGGL